MEFFSLGVTVCNDWEYCYSFSLLNQFDLCFVQSDVTLNTVLPLSPLSLSFNCLNNKADLSIC